MREIADLTKSDKILGLAFRYGRLSAFMSAACDASCHIVSLTLSKSDAESTGARPAFDERKWRSRRDLGTVYDRANDGSEIGNAARFAVG
jgi:hypothetical protein